jgi:hypothetical protein
MTVVTAPSRVRLRRLTVLAGAVVAAVLLWALFTALTGDLLVHRAGQAPLRVTAPAVLATALVVGLAAWGTLALAERLLRRPVRTWRIVAAVVLLLSLAGPLGGVDAGTKLALATLHATVGAILIAALPRR